MPNEDVSIWLRLRGGLQFKHGMDQAGNSTRRYGREAATASGRTKKLNTALSGANRHLGRGIKLAAGYVAGIAAIGGVRDAVKTTESLSKSTMALHRAFGLSVQDSSRWVAAADVRGLSANALTTSFNKNAKAVEAAVGAYSKHQTAMDLLGTSSKGEKRRQELAARGAGTQVKAFEELGITQAQLAAGRKDFQGLLETEAEAWSKIESPTKRAAIAQQLWGRGWAKMRPLLQDGAKGMREQLHLADKYGVTLNGKTVKGVNDLIAAERESKYASMGLQIMLGQTLIPTITTLNRKFAMLVRQVRYGGGKWAEFRGQVSRTAKSLEGDGRKIMRALTPVGQWAGRHLGTIVKVGGALFVASKALHAISAVRGSKLASLLFGGGRGGGVMGRLADRGAPGNPMYVVVLNKGGGGVGGGGKGGFFGRLGKGALAAAATPGGIAGAAVVGAVGLTYAADQASKHPVKGAQAQRDAYARQQRALGHGSKTWVDAWGLPHVKGHARGGMVQGQGYTDNVTRRLTPGEYVIRKDAVSAYGARNLQRINDGAAPEGESVTHVHVHLDGRQVAESVVRHTRKARALR